jgi:adenylyl cyclase-associated protein
VQTKKKALELFSESGKALKALDKPGSQLANHAKAICEALPAFTWVFAEPAPLGLIEAGRDSAEFWSNKVRKDSKEKTLPVWMQFANLLRDGINAQYAFVKENFKTGLEWNPRGAPAAEYPLTGGSAASATPPAAASVVPPAPVASSTGASAAVVSGSKPSLGAMFSQIASIDQSSGRTAGLRHVDKKQVAEEKTKAAPIIAVAPKAPAAHRDRDLLIPTGTAAVKLVEMRWNVEFQVRQSSMPPPFLILTPAAALFIPLIKYGPFTP